MKFWLSSRTRGTHAKSAPAELRTAEVGGCVCLAEAEKDRMLQQNKQ